MKKKEKESQKKEVNNLKKNKKTEMIKQILKGASLL